MMSNDRAIVFIDGNNLYHNLLKAIKNSKHAAIINMKPKDLDLFKLSELICQKFNLSRAKTIYYNSIPDIRDGQEVYYAHQKYLSWVASLPSFEVKIRKLQKRSNIELLNERLRLIEKSNLCKNCKPEAIKLLMQSTKYFEPKEKGIDVLIAADMLNNSLKGNCEAFILVSGDADFVPIFDMIKESGKKAFCAALREGFSSEMRAKHKPYLIIDDSIIEKCLKGKIGG